MYKKSPKATDKIQSDFLAEELRHVVQIIVLSSRLGLFLVRQKTVDKQIRFLNWLLLSKPDLPAKDV